jgi:uncharacterized membrane protein YhfC
MPMTMTMMKIGVVRVAVYHVNVPVPVSMWLARRIDRGMVVLVVGIVTVPMIMLERAVEMFVIVPFSQMQPQPYAH